MLQELEWKKPLGVASSSTDGRRVLGMFSTDAFWSFGMGILGKCFKKGLEWKQFRSSFDEIRISSIKGIDHSNEIDFRPTK